MQWEDINVKQFEKIQEITKNSDLDNTEKELEILKVVTNKDVENIPFVQLKKLVNEIQFLNTEIPVKKIKDTIKINNHNYRITKNIKDITTAQFIDYSNFANAKKMNLILSTILIPKEKFYQKRKKYNDGYDIDVVIADCNDLDIVTANSIAFFLFKKSLKSLLNSIGYFRIIRNIIPKKNK